MKNSALILLSGGQDSATCLAWAKQKFKNIYALTFEYGQRHKSEIKAAKKIAKLTQTPLKIYKTTLFKDLTSNSLINHDKKISTSRQKHPPNTFVDGRNHIFLSIAAIYAKQMGIQNIITGVCQTDFSGYPDCREDFIKSIEKTLSLAMDYKFRIYTPLMHLTKGQSIKLMKKLQGINLLKFTRTCYENTKAACGVCPSCKLRLKGFEEAKTKDPIKYINKTI